jgi:hypothetical protein
MAGPALAATAPSATRASSRVEKLPAKALNNEAMLHRTIVNARRGTRRLRSTSRPTGIVKAAPTSRVTELSSPRSALPMCRPDSSWGAIAPTVEARIASRTPTRWSSIRSSVGAVQCKDAREDGDHPVAASPGPVGLDRCAVAAAAVDLVESGLDHQRHVAGLEREPRCLLGASKSCGDCEVDGYPCQLDPEVSCSRPARCWLLTRRGA